VINEQNLKFNQCNKLTPNLNDKKSYMRAKDCSNDFEKNFYKLMNNAVFGKTMENVFNRINYKLVNSDNKLEKLTKKPSYEGKTDIAENLIGVSMMKDSVKLHKSIIAGFSILDLSKVLMYSFYYKNLKSK